MTRSDDAYLLDRHQAAARYGVSVRGLELMYKQHPDFPIIRVGKKVLVHRRKADEWFDDYIGDSIELE